MREPVRNFITTCLHKELGSQGAGNVLVNEAQFLDVVRMSIDGMQVLP